MAIRLLRYLSVGRFFNSFPCSFAYILSSGDATGLRGTFPGHPRPFHLTFTDIHNNIYTPMGALPDGTRTRADLAVVAERVLILPSTTLPSAPRRHTQKPGKNQASVIMNVKWLHIHPMDFIHVHSEQQYGWGFSRAQY
jgi:hypothetical protein